MLRLDKVIKPWKESAALNDHINLYGFWNETALRVRKGPSNGATEQPTKKLAAGVESTASVRAVKA